jgi:hypothetical protein
MPLAYPSTLDRRPPAAHCPQRSSSYVEGRWSPSLGTSSEKDKLKHTLILSVLFHAGARRVFLSQAGPRFDLALLQAEHHLVVRTGRAALETARATRWVALDWLGYAASGLARRPPSEGASDPGPAGVDRRGFAEERAGIRMQARDFHRRVSETIEQGAAKRKRSKRRSNDWRQNFDRKCVPRRRG